MHCLDCGEKCECVNYTGNSTKYFCVKCDSYWFRTSRVIVEYTKEKRKTSKEYDFPPINWDEY